MIWVRKKKDHYRWHRRFAVFPRRIGERMVWLGRYAWRNLPFEDRPKRPAAKHMPTLDVWEEWSLPNGYTAWLNVRSYSPFQHWDLKSWHKPSAKLKLAG